MELTDTKKFERALESYEAAEQACFDNKNLLIGLLGEKRLHAVIKRFIEPDISKHEIKIGKNYADIVNENGIFEIQTANVNKLCAKLCAFLKDNTVTVVHPVIHKKRLCWIDTSDGSISKFHKSGKVGSVYDGLAEMGKMVDFLRDPNLRIMLLLIDADEYRRLDGWSRDKKRGSTRAELVPVSLYDMVYIDSTEKYKEFVPEFPEKQFTAKEFRAAVKLSEMKASYALRCLASVGAVKNVGKKGRAYLYEKAI